MSRYQLPSEEELDSLNMTLEEALEVITPKAIGPTWGVTSDGEWMLPTHTLGWQIAAWCAEYLRADDGGPWNFTDEQLRFLLHWYAIDAEGKFRWRTGVLQRLKGWGKDPLLAVIVLVEFVGPSRFHYWDSFGQPMGQIAVRPWVQVAAVNQEQTQNTMSMLSGLASDRLIQTYRVKPGAELWRAMDGWCKIEAVTSNYRSLEGRRSTFVVLNETHHWVSGNGGLKMYETIDGNATKMGGRYLAITNAYLPGEDSVAERMRLAWEKEQERIEADENYEDIAFLYDSLEAHPKAPLSGPLLPYVLDRMRGDAVWLKPKDIARSIANTTISPARSRRMWLNQIVADEESLHGPETWDVLRDTELALAPGDEIVLGFDGSKSRDATALVAIRLADQAIFLMGLWERPDGPLGEKWQVDRTGVDSLIHDTFQTYSVVGFYADVREWESYIVDWAEQYANGLRVRSPGRDGISWDMRGALKRSTQAHERLMSAVFEGKVKHDGDRRLRRHILNAKRRVNIFGVYFGKDSPDSPRRIDAYAALVLAHECLSDLRTARQIEKPERKPGTVWFV